MLAQRRRATWLLTRVARPAEHEDRRELAQDSLERGLAHPLRFSFTVWSKEVHVEPNSGSTLNGGLAGGGQPSVSATAKQQASSRASGQTDRRWLGHAGGTPVQPREFRYGSWEFQAASDLAGRLPYSPPIWAVLGSVARNPALIRALLAVWRLPVVDLQVRSADADAWLTTCVGPVGFMLRGGRWAQAVLELPAVHDHYLTGRPKQALRTNLRHARNVGVTSGRIPTYEAWFEAANIILHARDDGPAAIQEMARPERGQQVAYYVARDADEKPLVFARVALFGQFAVLSSMLSRIDRHPSASWARYQLHTFLALDLGRAGVKHLLVGSALREPEGHQYFQHLLGYRARNLRVKVIESGAP